MSTDTNIQDDRVTYEVVPNVMVGLVMITFEFHDEGQTARVTVGLNDAESTKLCALVEAARRKLRGG